MIIDIIKQFLLSTGSCSDYTVQPYEWHELKNPEFNKYLVIIPQPDGEIDNEFETSNVRLVFVGDLSTNVMSLRRDVELVEESFLSLTGMFYDVYNFKLVSRPFFMRSKEGRPMFEINVRCNGVKYAC